MTKTVQLEVVGLVRLNNSVYGNPNYKLVGFEDGNYSSYRTSSDIADSYGVIPNELRNTSDTNRVLVELTLTRANRIKSVKVIA